MDKNIEKLIEKIKNNYNNFEEDNYNYIIKLKNDNELLSKYIYNNYNNLTSEERKYLINKINYYIEVLTYKYEKRKIEYENSLNLEKSLEKLFKYSSRKIDFYNYDEKCKYINNLIEYMIETKDSKLLGEIIEYFKCETKIQKQREIENKEIEKYQIDIKDFETEGPTDDNLEKYFNCLKHAIKSYDEKLFGKDYKFQIEGLNNFHKELNFNFSIPKEELPHLLGIKNPNYDDDNNIILKLYNNYLKKYNLTHNSDNYIEYVYNYLQNDLNQAISNNDINKNELNDYLIKSFNKCLTFLKVYEYKRIPEIIIDYQLESDYDVTHPNDHTKDLITKAGFLGEPPETENLMNISKDNLSSEEKNMIKKIKEQFGDNVQISIKIDSKTKKPDFKFILINDIVYKYNKNKYWADLNPNIFLVSYDKKLEDLYLNEKNGIINKYLNKALRILCAKLKKDLNINENKEQAFNVKKSNIIDKKRRKLINLETIKQLVSSSTISKETEKDFDIIINQDDKYAMEDYNRLRMYMKSMFGMDSASKINNMFGITETPREEAKNGETIRKYQEPPHLRMIHRIIDKLMRKSNKVYLQKDVSIIGYGTVRDKDANFREKFAKTLMGKTFLQLEYDLRVNGFSYKINSIKEKIGDNKFIYSNYPLLIEHPNINKQYIEALIIMKNEINIQKNHNKNK